MANQIDPLRVFKGPIYDTPRGPIKAYCCSASDRVEIVKKSSDKGALEDALRSPGLQKSVHSAITSRLKKL